jgi:hypothetical protein
MAHESTVLEIMEALVIADKHVVGGLMAHRGLWMKGVSAVNNGYKALNYLTDCGKLVKGDGYFKLPHCKSEYAEHARLLTKALAEIMKLNPSCKIFREHTIAEKGLRPDGIVVLKKEDQGLCFVLELCNHETESYLEQKINTWRYWPEANEYLSRLTGYKIPHFDIVRSTELTDYLKEALP